MYVCTCGFHGEDAKMVGPELYGQEAVCPECGASVSGTILMDVGSGERSVTKTWPNGKTWEKTIKTTVVELRLPEDVRRVSKYSWSNWGFGLFWEVARILDPEFPKKPKWNKDIPWMDWNKMKSDYYKLRNAHLNKVWSVMDLFNAMKREFYADVAKERTRAIVAALNHFPTCDTEARWKYYLKKMNPTFTLGDLWELAKVRQSAADGVIDGMIKRTTVQDALNALARRNDRNLDHVTNVMLSLMGIYGNITIRTSVLLAVKNTGCGMFLIRDASYTPYPKSTKSKECQEFMEAHKEDFFENPEFSMDRGKEVVDHEEETIKGYDPETGEMIEIRDFETYERTVTYHEWDSDDFETFFEGDYMSEEDELDPTQEYPFMSAGFERPDAGVEFDSAPKKLAKDLDALTDLMTKLADAIDPIQSATFN